MTAIRNAAEFNRWIAFVRQQPFPLDLEAKPWKPTRSNEQNAYLFGVCYPPLVARTGYTPEEIHTYALGTHFGWHDKKCPRTPTNPNGIESVPNRTTTRDASGKRNVLTKAEFSAFVDTVQRIAAEAGVFIPDALAA